jgi:16S rRNA (uracil1498-N3)-methyltransferase
MPPRFFVDEPLAVGRSVRLPAAVAHHARRVLRLGDGDALMLFDGRGGEYRATLQADGDAASAQVAGFDPVERESPLRLTLIQGLVAADKLDWIVEKAVELGVERIVVAPMRRSVVRLDAARAARRLRHWHDVVTGACGQCGRNRVPPVAYCATLAAALAAAPADGTRLLLLPTAASGLPSLLPGRRGTLLVGPEGGLDEDELKQATHEGFCAARLGPRILRTETAGLAAIAALQSHDGDLASC